MNAKSTKEESTVRNKNKENQSEFGTSDCKSFPMYVLNRSMLMITEI